LNLAKLAAAFALEKKAEEVVILDMRKAANFCDFFVICSGTSSRHVKAIAEGIDDGLASKKMTVNRIQGFSDCRWVILDCGNVVAHIFDPESRDFYGLEYLWQEAKMVSLDE
jgi:ribosome-associated protein